ncbi:MAG: pre-toxin TG domain-containing protein [Pirellulales bacterium]|nr:pre-toxin TG domain-containing protein [Pirellulales bacterium]
MLQLQTACCLSAADRNRLMEEYNANKIHIIENLNRYKELKSQQDALLDEYNWSDLRQQYNGQGIAADGLLYSYMDGENAEYMQGLQESANRATARDRAFWQETQEVAGWTSFAAGFVPGLGDAKDWQEVITGVDICTGEKLSTFDRVLTAGASFVPFVSGRVVRSGKKLLTKADDVVPNRGLLSQGQGELPAMDRRRYEQMKKAFESNAGKKRGGGGEIWDDEDAAMHLFSTNGPGTLGSSEGLGKIILCPNAPTFSVFEEFIHNTQRRTGRYQKWIEEFGKPKADLLAEIEAAQKLIKNANSWGISKNEVEIITGRLTGFQQSLDSL